MTPAPQPFRWDGESMVPLRPRAADQLFVIGQVYVLAEEQDRSAASHRHYFACVREAWLNLPEDQADRFKTPDDLRKHALIKAGYADQRSFVCGSAAEARRLAAFLQPLDTYVIVTVSGATVTEWRAKSQSMRAMGREVFQTSKDAVLGVLADMIGVDPSALTKAAA